MITVPLSESHSGLKGQFSCGKTILDRYLKEQAGQDVKRKLAVCFVYVDSGSGLIQGYYTLSNNSIPLDRVPPSFKKHLPPSYHSIPTTLLGRLAVDIRYHGRGIGKVLLIDALKRSFDVSESLGSFAVVVDPLDEEARRFYRKFDFIDLPDSGKMFMAMKTIENLFGDR